MRTALARHGLALVVALVGLGSSTAAAQTAQPQEGTAAPSPFEQPAQPSPFEQPQVTATATPPEVVVTQPAPMPAPLVYHQRSRGVSSLATGISMLVVTAVIFGIAGGVADEWEACEWEGDTFQCGHTGFYLSSMVLFGFGSLFATAGLVLLPIGIARLVQSRQRASRRGSRLAALRPFAAPTRDGGALLGLSGAIF